MLSAAQSCTIQYELCIRPLIITQDLLSIIIVMLLHYNYGFHESSEGLSSIIPKSRGIPPSACSGTPSLSTLQKAEPTRCLALRTRGGRFTCK